MVFLLSCRRAINECKQFIKFKKDDFGHAKCWDQQLDIFFEKSATIKLAII